MHGVNKVYEEPCMHTINRLGDKSINEVCTSPPYWQQRDYGHPDQWGLEPTYQEYLEHLWQMMDGLKRVLRDDGTVWINLGDSYGTNSGTVGGDTKYMGINANRGMNSFKHEKDKTLHKCLLLLPHRFAIGCIERGWIVRNDICWIKPNCQPESVTDRFSKKKEYFFLLTKSEDYYFDLDSIRDEHKESSIKSNMHDVTRRGIPDGIDHKYMPTSGRSMKAGEQLHELGKNPGDVSWFWDEPGKWTYEEYMEMCDNWYHQASDIWEISTSASNEEHFATYNYKLVYKPIIAGCPEFVCNRCGKARTKKWEKQHIKSYRNDRGEPSGIPQQSINGSMFLKGKFIGWNECKCNAGFRPGIIYDPFAGTGTTLRQAVVNNRWAIGSEIVAKNAKRANEQMGLFANQIMSI